jgi:hypothetical protein
VASSQIHAQMLVIMPKTSLITSCTVSMFPNRSKTSRRGSRQRRL